MYVFSSWYMYLEIREIGWRIYIVFIKDVISCFNIYIGYFIVDCNLIFKGFNNIYDFYV